MRVSPELHEDVKQPSHGLTIQLMNKLAGHKSNYWLGFVSDPVTALLFLFWDTYILNRSIYASIACYTAGILTVSLTEYALHRWIFHSNITLAHAGHGMHHDEPEALFGVPWFVTAAMWWSIAYVAVNVLHIPFVLSFMAAFITGYTVYAVIHHVLHQHHRGSRWIRKLRTHHRVHHRFPDVNFGVTNSFWDKVFGTTYARQDYNVRRASALK